VSVAPPLLEAVNYEKMFFYFHVVDIYVMFILLLFSIFIVLSIYLGIKHCLHIQLKHCANWHIQCGYLLSVCPGRRKWRSCKRK
jgi:hypothetical protein